MYSRKILVNGCKPEFVVPVHWNLLTDQWFVYINDIYHPKNDQLTQNSQLSDSSFNHESIASSDDTYRLDHASQQVSSQEEIDLDDDILLSELHQCAEKS